MNLIVCGENCRHQREGYCALDNITRLTKDTRAKCGYYEDLDNWTEDPPVNCQPPPSTE